MKEPGQISKPEYSVDKIVARMQEAAARKGQFEESASSAVFTSAEFRSARKDGQLLAEIDIQPLTLQPSFYPQSDGRYHVNDLLKFHDRTFVQNAYRAILKRGPDATGYKGLLESLRSARLNKIDILAALRYSPEGRAKKVEVAGLRGPALIRKAYRVPVLGYLLNLGVALARLPLLIRSQQQFAAHMLAQQELVAEHLNHLGRTLRVHGGEVSQALERQSQSLKQVAGTLAEQLGKIDELRHQCAELRRQHEQLSSQIVQREQQLEQQLDHREQQQASRLLELLNEQAGVFERSLAALTSVVDERVGELATLLQQEVSQRENQDAHFTAESDQLQQSLEILGGQLGELTSKWEEALKSFQIRALQWRAQIAATESELRQADSMQREQLELTGKNLKREIDRVFEKQQAVTAELVLQEQRVATLLTEARNRLPAPFDEAQLHAFAGESGHRLDAFYAAFDEEFRGGRAEIKQRLKVYLPLIAKQGIGSAELPILDVGCGRGEWLELLQEEQLAARGVDSNRVLVAQCRARGLDVTEAELLSYLRGLADESVGAVSGFHIIEHLPLETLIEFLNEAVRVLKPGGAVIFETPNPENVLVGSCNFYFDPTHRNPVPSQVLNFFLESRGFVGVEILKLNPSDDTPVADESDLARRFNHYFYGPMDYAAIGYR